MTDKTRDIHIGISEYQNQKRKIRARMKTMIEVEREETMDPTWTFLNDYSNTFSLSSSL
jgi:hypothetical protein